MNRTFLIFLMIGTALMIMVIGDRPSDKQLDYMPWQIDIQNNGNLRVFGITLEKTQIQDANQILSSFAETRLIKGPTGSPQLVAIYNELNLGGFLAKIELQYNIAATELNKLAKVAVPVQGTDYAHLPDKQLLKLLSANISKLTYTPAIDYQSDVIFQRFGQPQSEQQLNAGQQLWLYPDQGLEILVNEQGLDLFIYSPIKQQPNNGLNEATDKEAIVEPKT